MFTQLDLLQVQYQLPQLLEIVIKGEEIVITQDNQPLAKIVPFLPPKTQNRQPGSGKGLVIIADDFDEPLAEFQDYI